MSFAEALALAGLTIAVMFGLIFVMAGVETRMFDAVVEDAPGEDAGLEPQPGEPAVELGRAA